MSTRMTVPVVHIPVLLKEATESLEIRQGGHYVDCTVGTGGHTLAMLERALPGGRVLGLDADPEAIEIARERLTAFGSSLLLVNENFAHLEDICARYDFYPIDGILFDLGLSSLQLDRENRGFSFQKEAPLDMRANPSQKLTAADIVNGYAERDLAQLIYEYGEERSSRRIARSIVEKRPVASTLELARITEQAVKGRRGRIHPATRTFQALRIAVNDELGNLRAGLEQAARLLTPGGRLVVIAYHSLEDRMVKNFMRREEKGCRCASDAPTCHCGYEPTLSVRTRKVITPTAMEKLTNPRSHSARMRVAERLPHKAGNTIADQGSAAHSQSGSGQGNENSENLRRALALWPRPRGSTALVSYSRAINSLKANLD